MSVQKKISIGLIGLGNIGRHHAGYLKEMDSVEFAGVCDISRERADGFAKEYGTKAYYCPSELFDEPGLEAVIIATPHFEHTSSCIDAFKRGIHVMCEKPLAVHVNDAKKTVDAYEKAKSAYPNLVFGIMFSERVQAYYKKIKDIIDSGELGKLTRATWINTAWFRTQAYYNSGVWRATWAGEGGGILTNQCPHDLDVYQWLFGMPSKVCGHANIGKYHDIEVEDEVTAYFEHDNGMIGHFTATTAEAPGTKRLEIAGENGKLVYEDQKLVFFRNRTSMLKVLKESKESFADVENWQIEIPAGQSPANIHKSVTGAFIDRITCGGGQLVAEGTDGIKSVAVANAIMLSSFKGKTIELPFDGDEYENLLKELIKGSRFVKNTGNKGFQP